MPSLIALRAALLSLLLLALAGNGRAGVAAYTDRGKVDFDTAMSLLNPYGTWTRNGSLWCYTPLDRGVPYTDGRWLYTEFGWTWLGRQPHSWLTEHYGYWKRGADHVWSWYPGPFWLPQTVEIRAAPSGIGWRSGEVDRDGNFVESPSERYTKIDEWSFVSLSQFASPITPAVIAKPDVAEGLLEESIESHHSYLTYRDLQRPGPHPADFVNLGDGKMFAPTNSPQKAPVVKKVATKSDVPQPALMGVNPDDPVGDPRQVPYWLTMSLPTFWTPPPPDAGRNEVYLYRPDFYQDQDGIERRIALWLNPNVRASETLHLQEVLNQKHTGAAPDATSAVPPSTAPSAPAHSSDPFASPFEDSFHSSGDQKPAASSAKPSVHSAGAPVGTNVAPATATP